MTLTYRPFAPRVLENIAAQEMGSKGRHVQGSNFAVDIENMIDDRSFQVVFRKKLLGNVEAYCTVSGHIFVQESALVHLDRYRFTLGEEFAHVILHLPWLAKNGCDSVLEANLTVAGYSQFEKDAKYLGAALLMDARKFRERFYHWSDMMKPRGFICDQARTRAIVKACAQDFQVSLGSAGRRAQSVGLISKEASIRLAT